ncbi:MAG: IS3 family transposase, partial [Oscillospiraceae bacterium]|nr:IS3 family transposase [Oscillospiraceae bacterium]
MNKVISEKIKTSIIEQVVFGDDVRDVAEKYHVSKTSIYRWLNDYKYKQKYNTDNLLTLTQMKRNMDRATQKLHILSSAPCGANSPLLPRYKYIEKIEDIYGLNLCCEAMNVNKSSHLNYKLRGKRGDTVYAKRQEEAKPLIEEIFYESRRTYGVNRIYSVLKSRGYDYGVKLIRKVMQENDMFVIGTNAKKN